MSDFPADRVTLARILRPHGRKGEVACEILTDFPERLARRRSVLLWDGDSTHAPRRADVLSCWVSRSRGGQAIFHFADCHSISDAEKLRDLLVQAPLSERVVLPAGSYYITDLIGCAVFIADSENAGRQIGVVRDVQVTGEDVAGTPLLVLDSSRGELLIPLATEICRRIDTAAGLIEIAPPEGLLDLNRL